MMSPSFTLLNTTLMVFWAFFVFQSRVSMDQRMAGTPFFAKFCFALSLTKPPGGRMVTVRTPAMDWSVSSSRFRLANSPSWDSFVI